MRSQLCHLVCDGDHNTIQYNILSLLQVNQIENNIHKRTNILQTTDTLAAKESQILEFIIKNIS